MSTNKPTATDGFVRGKQVNNALARHSLFIFFGLGLVALVALVQFGENGIFSFFNLRAQEAELRQEVVELEAGNLEKEQQITALAEDPEALEKLVREEHDMQGRDEEVLRMVPLKQED